MKKQVSFSTQGSRADLGPLAIQRMLPNRYAVPLVHLCFWIMWHQPLKTALQKMGWVRIHTAALPP